MADRIQPLTPTRLPSLEELEAMPSVVPAAPATLPSLAELEATPARPQLPSLAELEGAPKRVLPTFEELADTPLTVSVSGKPLSPETQKILVAQAKEKKAYDAGFLGTLDILRPEAREAIGGTLAALTTGKKTSDAEVKAIAEKYDIPFEDLRRISPLLLAIPEERSAADIALQAAGYVSEAVAGLPVFAAKKLMTDDPNFRGAIDELRGLARERVGLAEWIGINVLPAALATKALKGGASALQAGEEVVKKTLARQVGEGAAIGAAFGLGGSSEGEEELSAVIGAVAGGGLAAASRAIPATYNKIKNVFFDGSEQVVKAADNQTQSNTLRYAANNEADITNAVDVMYEAIKDVETNVKDAALHGKEIAPEIATKIATEVMTPDQRRVAEVAIVERYIKSLPVAERKVVDIPEGIVSDGAVASEYIKVRQKEFAKKLKKEIPDLASVIDKKTGKPRPAATKEVLREAQRIGVEELDAKWDDALRENLAKDAIEKYNIKLGDSNPVGKTIVNGIVGRQFGVKVIDEATGIDASLPFNKVNAGNNLLTAERQSWRKFDKANPTGTISGIYRAARSVKDFLKFATTSDETNKYYTALADRDLAVRKAAFEALTPAEQKILGYVSSFFEKVRERANSVKGDGINPLNIPFREDFGAPNITVEPTKYIIKLKGKQAEAEKVLGAIKDLNSSELQVALQENTALKDLVAGLRLIDTKLVDSNLVNGRALMNAMRDITSGGTRGIKLYRVAGTALARRESIPDYLLEKNLFKLMDRYMDTTMRNVYTRRPLEELASKARILDKMGRKTDAEFIKRIVQDHYGIRAWSAAKLFNEGQIAISGLARTIAQKFNWTPKQEQAFMGVMNYIPEAISNIQYNIYPNVLGMNGKSHLTNLMQSWTKGAPELGGFYGYGNVGKAFFTTAFDMKRLEGKVKEYGLQPTTYIREYQDAIEEGLARSTAWQFTKEQYANFVKAWMYSYVKVEDFNRALIVNIAETLMKDLAEQKPGAVRALAKMPLAVRRSFMKAKGNTEAQTKLLAQHLNSVTAYNYNRASMAEIGVHLGPFFSTFTKWPTETLGDILADMRTKGTVGAMPRLLEKYAVTWAITNAMDSTLNWAASNDWEMFPDFKKMDPQIRYWTGASGLRTAAPIYSLGQLMPAQKNYERNPFTPVVLSTLWNDIMLPAWEGEDDKVRSGAMRALQTFAPGGMISRVLMRDIPMAFENQEATKWEK